MHKNDMIKACKKIAEINYDKGYDAIVECCGDSDWEDLYIKCGGFLPKMKKQMAEEAGLWIEQNLNARWGEDDDHQLTMFD